MFGNPGVQPFIAIMEIALSYHPLFAGAVKFNRYIDEGLREKGRGAAAELARLLGISAAKVSKMRSGERDPQAEELPIIEQFIGKPAPTRISLYNPSRAATMAHNSSVRVVGYVGAGAKAHFYGVSQADFLDEVPAPIGTTSKTVAVEIKGDSLGSIFDRWLVFYDDMHAPVTENLLGKLCVVGLANDQVLVKKLRRGKAPGTFDLVSEKGETIRNVKVDWAARVKIMAPR